MQMKPENTVISEIRYRKRNTTCSSIYGVVMGRGELNKPQQKKKNHNLNTEGWLLEVRIDDKDKRVPEFLNIGEAECGSLNVTNV